MKAHHIKVSKTARYFTIGNPGPAIEKLWICTHGYGQEIEKFTSKFKDLDDGKTLIIAPEGLSRFYFGGFTGHVGASWMTKEERLHEIDDYCLYIESIYHSFIGKLVNLRQTTLFGFSQGCPTIIRWAVRFRHDFQNLVLWAGQFAHDIDYPAVKDWLNSKRLTLVIGDQDEFLTPQRVEAYKGFLEKNNLQVDVVSFAGKHMIDRKILIDLANKIQS
ncbi:MAG: alpha/beta hydrolase [Bacteroidota bacterium]